MRGFDGEAGGAAPGRDGAILGSLPGLDGAAHDAGSIEALMGRSRHVPAGKTIVEAGAWDDAVYLVKSGWACEYRTLAKDGCQIVSLLLPGDFCGLRMGAPAPRPCGLSAVTACDIASVPRPELLRSLAADPSLAAKAWAAALRQHLLLVDRLVSLGRRTALERMAHLLCELVVRRSNAPLATDPTWWELPLSQAELSDVLGLSAVHVNRVLQTLRGRRLIETRRGRYKVLDMSGLFAVADFRPNDIGLD